MTAPVTAAILLSLVTGVSGAQSPASAPSPESSNRAQAAELSSTDRAFITTAAEGGKAEIELGQLAQQKASTDAVKALGKRIADDHQPCRAR
jgi:putative membrane protein